MRSIITLLILASLSTGCGLMELKDKLLTAAANAIPWEFENTIGDQLLPSILPPATEISDAILVKQLEQLIAPISAKVDKPEIKIHIAKDQALNAFAIPGGHLIFNSGMLLAVESPEEILGVAAHEVAHAVERHSMRSMIQGFGIYALLTIFMGDISGLGVIIIDQGRALLQNGFSRSQERAADAVGLRLLLEAKIDPRGMIDFFERLEAQKKGRPQTSILGGEFMSTHPLTADRIAAIKGAIAAVPESERKGWRKTDFDLRAFQARLSR